MTNTAETRVLLIEDSETDALLVLNQLAQEPIVVLRAKTLAEAIPLVDEVDLLIVDLTLPDSTCTQTITHIVHGCSKPVLILTGTSDPDIAYQLGHAGTLGTFLIKPVRRDQLLVSIAWAFGLYKRLQERCESIMDILAGKEDHYSGLDCR